MRRRESGFTLVEVLVALAIATLLAAALYRGLGVGWRALRIADREAAAVDVARARLAAIGVETPLEAGQRSGVDAGVRWSETVVPHDGDADETETGSRAASGLYRVTVEVRWHDGGARGERSFTLVTLKRRTGE